MSEQTTEQTQKTADSLPETLSENGNTPDFVLDEFLLTALSNPRDRIVIIKLEQDLEQFLDDPKIMQLELPTSTSYHRLIIHRVAQYFFLNHTSIDADGKKMIFLEKTENSKIPVLRLSDFLEKEQPEPQTPEAKPLKIMQRKSEQPSKTPPATPSLLKPESKTPSLSPSVPSQPNSPPPVDRSLERREEEYAKARARIFGESESNTNIETSNVNVSSSPSPSNNASIPPKGDQKKKEQEKPLPSNNTQNNIGTNVNTKSTSSPSSSGSSQNQNSSKSSKPLTKTPPSPEKKNNVTPRQRGPTIPFQNPTDSPGATPPSFHYSSPNYVNYPSSPGWNYPLDNGNLAPPPLRGQTFIAPGFPPLPYGNPLPPNKPQGQGKPIPAINPRSSSPKVLYPPTDREESWNYYAPYSSPQVPLTPYGVPPYYPSPPPSYVNEVPYYRGPSKSVELFDPKAPSKPNSQPTRIMNVESPVFNPNTVKNKPRTDWVHQNSSASSTNAPSSNLSSPDQKPSPSTSQSTQGEVKSTQFDHILEVFSPSNLDLNPNSEETKQYLETLQKSYGVKIKIIQNNRILAIFKSSASAKQTSSQQQQQQQHQTFSLKPFKLTIL